MTTRTASPEPFIVERPWGNFQQFVTNEPVTVKIITINPQQRLSLQRHAVRDEFWQVLDGVVTVQCERLPGGVLKGDIVEELDAKAGSQIWVPRASSHRLWNRTNEPVRVLELAFGVFSEDDITRLHDDYHRS